jgi:hypothetical protein
MKILSIILLVISAFAVCFDVFLAYLVRHPYFSQCEFGKLCIQVMPNRLVPLWWPPIGIMLWILSLLKHLKGRFGQSVLLSAVIIASLFIFNWFGARGFWGIY